MLRPNTAQLAYGSATVVLATVALLLLSGTTTTLGIAAVCVATLLLGILVAVTMPRREQPVKPSERKEVRVPAQRVGAGSDTRIPS
ncbi:hypothetical protein ACFW2Y_02180 [Streptomyces sp. NPDC058877]|uniref:hypothetical protein n=1 Tax=Streptomyces sp. NPDC058877 TaxID=3346665 RepID=UPI0036C393E5